MHKRFNQCFLDFTLPICRVIFIAVFRQKMTNVQTKNDKLLSTIQILCYNYNVSNKMLCEYSQDQDKEKFK